MSYNGAKFVGTAGTPVMFPLASYENPAVATWFVAPSTVTAIVVPACPAVGVFDTRFPKPSYPNDCPHSGPPTVRVLHLFPRHHVRHGPHG